MNTYFKVLIPLIAIFSFNVFTIQTQTAEFIQSSKAQVAKNFTINADCPAPFNLEVTDITSNSVILTWESELQEVTFSVTYTNEIGESTTISPATSPPLILDGLDAGMTYHVEVQVICPDGSTASSSTIFTTSDVLAVEADLDIIPFPGVGGTNSRNLFINDKYKDNTNTWRTDLTQYLGVACIAKIWSPNPTVGQQTVNNTQRIQLINGSVEINCADGMARYTSNTGNPYDYFEYEIADASTRYTTDRAIVLICPSKDRGGCSVQYVKKMAKRSGTNVPKRPVSPVRPFRGKAKRFPR